MCLFYMIWLVYIYGFVSEINFDFKYGGQLAFLEFHTLVYNGIPLYNPRERIMSL